MVQLFSYYLIFSSCQRAEIFNIFPPLLTELFVNSFSIDDIGMDDDMAHDAGS